MNNIVVLKPEEVGRRLEERVFGVPQRMKAIRLTKHALEQCGERGASESEVRHALRTEFESLQRRIANYAVSILTSRVIGREPIML